MTTYSKETALYNNDAIASDISDAGNAYKAVVTEVGTTGVKIHPSSQSGNNIVDYTLIDDDGLEVYDGGTSVAAFGEDGARIGKAYVANANDNESHVEIDYHSMQLVDKDGDAYFHVSDLRDKNGVYGADDTFYADGSARKFYLSFTAVDTSYYVTVSNGSGGAVTKNVAYVEFETAPSSSAVITVNYDTNSSLAKAFTFGSRLSGLPYPIGPMSTSFGSSNFARGAYSFAAGHHSKAKGDDSFSAGVETEASGRASSAFGYTTTASGSYSHAEGSASTASGFYSHAEGYSTTSSASCCHAEGSHTEAKAADAHAQNSYTKASSNSQTAIGKFNVEDANGAYALIVGNGTADNARSNAATIAWDGNYIAQAMAGVIQMFAGSTPPTGWLVCDGSAVSRTTYATLYAAIGTTWGTGNGSTTFNLPDLRGRAPIGAGTGSSLTARTLGGTGGSEKMQQHNHGLTGGITSSGTCSITSSGGHTHTITTKTANVRASGNLGMAWSGGTGTSTAFDSIASNTGTHTHTVPNHTHTNNLAVSNSGDGQAGNMQPFAVVNFIICTGKTS